MRFNNHSDLSGEHAFLGASKYHWIRYDKEKLANAYTRFLSVQRGVELHDFARRCIELGIKLPKTNACLNRYVNDAIGFRMTPEQPLFYSFNSFGTADAISFKENILRIHDLKTGVSPVSMDQLQVYAALFCLEYDIRPQDIHIELRIYQGSEIIVHTPGIEDIEFIMSKIVDFDKEIDKYKKSEE